MDLNSILEQTAYDIVELGTRERATTLEVFAAAAHVSHPGAAEALVDWEGSEIARLRAFGIVHGALRRQPEAAHQQILTRLRSGLRVALAA